VAVMTEEPQAVCIRFADVRLDRLRQSITRRFVHSDELMLAEVRFAAGNDVEAHRHHNEQFTFVLEGALKFRFGDAQVEERVVSAGEVVIIPGNLLHSAVALADTYELDIFTPPRQDWIEGTDDYMRR
jgi:quercetin dioxygenase-like cupin family protein